MTRLMILIFLFVYFSSSAAGRAPCDANGMCKYGGVCGPDNKCSCKFNCQKPTWDFSYDSMYCLPQPGSSRPKLFRNICFLMVTACELQEEIPIIKFDVKKPRGQRCQAHRMDDWRLCPRPEDFMGPCGGTLNPRGILADAGVCLQEKFTNITRCECPSTKIGEDCQGKFVSPLAATGFKAEDKQSIMSSKRNSLAIIISSSATAGILFGIVVFVLLRFRAGGKCGEDVEQTETTRMSPFIGKQDDSQPECTKDNRFDYEFYICDKGEGHAENLNECQTTKLLLAEKSRSTEFRIIAETASPERRQRINGLSVCTSASDGGHDNVQFSSKCNNNNNEKCPQVPHAISLYPVVRSRPIAIPTKMKSKSTPKVAYKPEREECSGFEGIPISSLSHFTAHTL